MGVSRRRVISSMTVPVSLMAWMCMVGPVGPVGVMVTARNAWVLVRVGADQGAVSPSAVSGRVCRNYLAGLNGTIWQGDRGGRGGSTGLEQWRSISKPKDRSSPRFPDFLYRNAISDEVVEAASENPRHGT